MRLPPLDLNSVDISGMSQELKRLKADFSPNNNVNVISSEVDSLITEMVAMQSQMSELMQMMTRLQPPRQEYAQVLAKSPAAKMHPASISPQQDIDNHHKDVLLPLKQGPRYQSGPSKVSGAAAIPDDKESNVELHAALGQSNPKAIPENKNDQEF